MHITVLAGGVGGARFTKGLRTQLSPRKISETTVSAAGKGTAANPINVIVNTGDDIWLAGLRLMPDFDSLLYALAGVNDTERGWGRTNETERVAGELREWGVGWPWFTLGDLDLGTHIARTSWLREGLSISDVTDRLQRRWQLGARLIPATDTEVDTWVETQDGTKMHFQEWWTRHRAQLPARAFSQQNLAASRPTVEALKAVENADVVLIAPSNPVVSIGTILAIPGMRAALSATKAPIVGISPVIGGKVVRGMADACLATIGVATEATAIGLHYGSRAAGGLLNGWLIDEVDAAGLSRLHDAGIAGATAKLLMHDLAASARLADVAIQLAQSAK